MVGQNRFKALVHYVCWKCSDNLDQLGAVKLNKTLWYTDSFSYRLWGEPISGEDAYIKREFGPVPKHILATLRELESEGIIEITITDYHGYPKRQYVCKTPADTSVFSKSELQLIDEVIDFVCKGHTATSISELSHDAAWRAVAEGQEIPLYATLGVRAGAITDEHISWANSKLKELYPNVA